MKQTTKKVPTKALISSLIKRVSKDDNGFIYIGILSESTGHKVYSAGFGETAFHKAMDAAFEKATDEHCRWRFVGARPFKK
jgi:hypothetical protein